MATSTPAARSRTERPPGNTTSAPSAVALLTQDHRDVEAPFKKFEGMGTRAHKAREATVGTIIEALSKHAVIEEQVFDPEVRSRVTDLDEDVLEALEEHHVVKWMLAAKKAAPTRPHPRSPDTPPGNVVAAAITAPLDAAASVIGCAAGKIRDATR